MKTTLLGCCLFLFLFCFSFAAKAEECRLKNPIPILEQWPEYGFAFANAEVSEIPRFANSSAFLPGRDTLNLHVFRAKLEGVEPDPGYWGAGLSSDTASGEGLWVGNAVLYFGLDRDDFIGELSKNRGEATRIFLHHMFFLPVGGNEDPWFGCTICRSGDALEKAVIKERDGNIVSVKLTFPVEVEWKNAGGETLLAYTGEHQTLCVTAADTAPSLLVIGGGKLPKRAFRRH